MTRGPRRGGTHGGINDVTLITPPKGVIILVIAWGWALAPPIAGSVHLAVIGEAEAEGDTSWWPSGGPLSQLFTI